jgi:hypothetical protein
MSKTNLMLFLFIQIVSFCTANGFLKTCINDKIKTIILSICDVLRNIAADAATTQMNITTWWTICDEKLKGLGFNYQVCFLSS